MTDLQSRAKACADEVSRIQAIIDGLKGGNYADLTNQIRDADSKITVSRTRVS